MSVLLANVRGRDCDQRNASFVAIGLISIVIKDHTKLYLTKVLEIVRSVLPSKVLLY